MNLELITPEQLLFTGEILQVNAPGTEGDFGVLPGHEPFVTTLRQGEIDVETKLGRRRFLVEGGVAEVTPEKCVILAESARELAEGETVNVA